VKKLLLILLLLSAPVFAEETTTKVVLDIKDVQAVVTYLSKQPYKDVYLIIVPLLKAKPVKEEKEKK